VVGDIAVGGGAGKAPGKSYDASGRIPKKRVIINRHKSKMNFALQAGRKMNFALQAGRKMNFALQAGRKINFALQAGRKMNFAK